MLSYETHTEASLVHLWRAGGVAEPGRRVRHGAESLVLGQPTRCQPRAFARPVHHAAAAEAVALTHPDQSRRKIITKKM